MADQLNFADAKLVTQLRDSALEVDARQCKNALAQMLFIKTAFVKKTLVEWFSEKFESQYLEIDILVKNQYERNNPIDWNKDKCVTCQMPLKVDPTNHKTPSMEMSYGDFFIRFEHKFLRNIYLDERVSRINTSKYLRKLLPCLSEICKHLYWCSKYIWNKF